MKELAKFQAGAELCQRIFFGNFAKSCGRLQLRKKQTGIIDLVLVLRTLYAKSKSVYKSL